MIPTEGSKHTTLANVNGMLRLRYLVDTAKRPTPYHDVEITVAQTSANRNQLPPRSLAIHILEQRLALQIYETQPHLCQELTRALHSHTMYDFLTYRHTCEAHMGI